MHSPVAGTKRALATITALESEFIPLEVPAKKQRIFDEEDEGAEDETAGGIILKVNDEFARRFEHNKKREELQKLEEKYGRPKFGLGPGQDDEEHDDISGEESSTDESEDDEGILATEALDQEILATLNAIRSHDPRVYDKNTKFYSEADPEVQTETTRGKEKPLTLKEYHRKNLLSGENAEENGHPAPISYVKQQEDLKRSLVLEMHNAAGEGSAEDEDEDFLKPIRASSPAPRPVLPDLAVAEQDPEKFLTEFLASRAWVPTTGSRFAALESDDDEQYDRAEEFETKYNLRFEDPEKVNRTLVTYARDAIAEKTVRRDGKSARKRAREKEREKKEAAKKEREEERARLRKLKVDQMEEKAQMIREAAGLRGKDFKIEEWADVLEADWDDEQWDQEMSRRFGEAYYQDKENMTDSDDAEEGRSRGKRKMKKPKWDNDIDVNDIIPDFDDSGNIHPALHLTDDDDDDATFEAESSKREVRAMKASSKAAQRRDRRIINALVDQNAPLDLVQPGAQVSKAFTPFRYRETSPRSFGLTPLDILAASDAQLNQFAGLKKLAPFRDPERKRKDKKHLGKKARLRQWRKEAFGRKDGPDRESMFAPLVDACHGTGADNLGIEKTEETGVNVREGERKKKRRKRGKKSKELQMEA